MRHPPTLLPPTAAKGLPRTTRRPGRVGCAARAALALVAALRGGAAGAQPPGDAPATVPGPGSPPAAARVEGRVRRADGAPLTGANVFVLGSLDGAVTDSAGRFGFATTTPVPRVLVVRLASGAELRRVLTGGEAPVLELTMGERTAALTPVVVQAGRHEMGPGAGATLSALEVVTTPGSTADVFRALQTLPGVQQLDEGTALFVRGGDFTETRTVLDGAPLLNPPQLLTPTGTFVGSADPFQLESITFSSGGFGARHGNALSGVVELATLGRPSGRAATLGLGLGAASVTLATPIGARGGGWVAANRFDTAPILRLNGAPRPFAPAPHGHDLAASASWRPTATGTIKLYALDTRTRLGVLLEEPSFAGSYAADVAGRLAVLSWRDVVGRAAPWASIAWQRLDRTEEFGAFALGLGQRVLQLAGGSAWEAHPRAVLRAGMEGERLASALDGTLPTSGAAVAPGARRQLLGGARTLVRHAAWAEGDWRATERLRLLAGVRTDAASLTGRRSVDPRLSATWQLGAAATLTAAWGIYHQVPDPLLSDPVLGAGGALPPMRATQSIVGVRLGGERRMLRLELFDKRYRDLTLLGAEPGRDRVARAGGIGRARGADLVARSAGPWGVEPRLTWSVVRAERTDPVTGRLAPAPADVTHALTGIAERAFAGGWRTAVAWRSATGRPFTPVARATPDADGAGWTPVWGAPMSARFPDFRRLDLSLSRVRPFGARTQGVFYLALTNALDRRNVQAWRYSADWAERTPVRSIFNRAVYVGATLQHR